MAAPTAAIASSVCRLVRSLISSQASSGFLQCRLIPQPPDPKTVVPTVFLGQFCTSMVLKLLAREVPGGQCPPPVMAILPPANMAKIEFPPVPSTDGATLYSSP